MADVPFKLTRNPTDTEPWGVFECKNAADCDALKEFAAKMGNPLRLSEEEYSFFFRGHADAQWSLRTTLDRSLMDKNGKQLLPKERALKLEFDSIHYYQSHARGFLPANLIPKDGSLDWLALMQHFSSPTRFLDWTASLNVALYFAVSENLNTDGAIWILEANPLTIYMEAKFGNVPDKKQIAVLMDNLDLFVNYGLKDKERVHLYSSEIKTERDIAQAGVFTFCEQIYGDHAMLIGKALLGGYHNGLSLPLTKIIVQKEVKRSLLQYLHQMGITAATLFPGMDGIGRSIKEIIKVESGTNNY